MRIQHNLSAMNAYRQLQQNTGATSVAMEKLSSGKRINKAADDSAGLGISQKMIQQIRGLRQAQDNIDDGINLCQTAEGGLGQIADPMLARIRELSIQAANETLTSEDRAKIQTEIDQILAAIDDCANHTAFNTIKPLVPPSDKVPPGTSGGKADIVFIIDNTGSMGGPIDNVKNNIDSFVTKLQNAGVDVQLGLVVYGDTHFDGTSITKQSFTSDLAQFKNSIGSITVYGGNDENESGLEAFKDPNGALSYAFRPDASKQFILITDAPVHDNTSDPAPKGVPADDYSAYNVQQVVGDLKAAGVKTSVISKLDNYVHDQLSQLSTATNGAYLDINGAFASGLDTLAGSIIVDTGSATEGELGSLLLQVGPNPNEVFEVQLCDVRTQSLKIDDILVDPFDKAIEALGKIDAAIAKVSDERTKFGVYANALEHVRNNVANTFLNVSAAESQITDADMAKEMMNLTRQKILEQSSQAMLAHASQLPQQLTDSLFTTNM